MIAYTALPEAEKRDISYEVRVRRTVRMTAYFVLMLGVQGFLTTFLVLFVLIVSEPRDGLWWAVIPGTMGLSSMTILTAVSGKQGKKWAVAVNAIITSSGLLAVFLLLLSLLGYVLMFKMEMSRLKLDDVVAIAICLAVLVLTAWLGWRKSSVEMWYLRSGNRDALFPESGKALSKAMKAVSKLTRRFQEAVPSRKARAFVYALSATPAALLSLLVLILVSESVLGLVSPEWEDFLGELLGSLSFFTSLLVAFYGGRYALRHIALNAGELQAADQRAPVLILRSFKDENITIPRELNIIFPFLTFLPRRLDELLADVLGDWGPVITIGQPNESLPPLGAAREYSESDAWKSLVETRIQEAQLIVAILGDTKGLAWEVAAAERLGVRQKLVLIVPPLLTKRKVAERWANISKALEQKHDSQTAHTWRGLPLTAMVVKCDQIGLFAVTARQSYRRADGYRIALSMVLPKRTNHRSRKSLPTGDAREAGVPNQLSGTRLCLARRPAWEIGRRLKNKNLASMASNPVHCSQLRKWDSRKNVFLTMPK